jgi:hypothetical protein
MTTLFNWRTSLIAVVAFAVCLLISHQTKDTSGAEGAVSWVTFVGTWIALVVALLAGAGATVNGLRRARH